jgi:hypothetical protein
MYKKRNLKLKIDFAKAEISKLNSFPPTLNFLIALKLSIVLIAQDKKNKIIR